MNNNDVLRRVRYIFDLSDDQMIKIFGLADKVITRAEVSDYLRKDDHPDQVSLYDKDLAIFLNGFVNLKRGKQSGPARPPEKTLTNNLILRKLKIALNLQTEDIIDVLQSVDLKFSKHEITAFFRRPGTSQYRLCKDQILRNFIYGLQKKYRPSSDDQK